MKINPIAGQTAISAYKAQRVKSPATEYQQSADKVSLSEEVVSFSSTINKIKEQMDVRTPAELSHIEEITRLIHGGSYHVDSDKVADKIVDEYMGINK